MNAPAREFTKEMLCAACGDSFVIVAPHQKYCGDACAAEGRKASDQRRYRALHPVVQKRVLRQRCLKPEFGQPLNENEEDVLFWIAKGKSDDMIAEIIGTTVETVRRLMADAKVRLGATSRGHAVALLLIREGYAKAF